MFRANNTHVKQIYHTIIKPTPDGSFVGWVEEVPGTITQGSTVADCRRNLRDALAIILESLRSEARIGLDESCLQEMLEIDLEREFMSASM